MEEELKSRDSFPTKEKTGIKVKVLSLISKQTKISYIIVLFTWIFEDPIVTFHEVGYKGRK